MNPDVHSLTPNPEPLFSLDLKSNGGLLAPTSMAEAKAWVEAEKALWQWVHGLKPFHHNYALKAAVTSLELALSMLDRAAQVGESDSKYLQQIRQAGARLDEAYVQYNLPHSSTPLAWRIEDFRKSHGDFAADFYASVYVRPPESHAFAPSRLDQWMGLAHGLVDRIEQAADQRSVRVEAETASLDLLREKAEKFLGEKSTVYDELHRQYAGLSEQIGQTANQQALAFAEAQQQRGVDFDKLRAGHALDMESLRKAFREEISMRAPVEYWDAKRRHHVFRSRFTGALVFIGMAATGAGLWWLIIELIQVAPGKGEPETWRWATLALAGLLSVWALRLVVRIFLSHLHLASDAAERVVMTRTYLSLLEGNRLARKDDRQLILQALFRPTPDGIVKDEGIPPSMFELFTRQSKP